MAKKKPIIVTTKSTESVVSGPEKRLMDLIDGAKPLNESEEKMVKEIEEIKKKGYIIDIPFD